MAVETISPATGILRFFVYHPEHLSGDFVRAPAARKDFLCERSCSLQLSTCLRGVKLRGTRANKGGVRRRREEIVGVDEDVWRGWPGEILSNLLQA